MTSTLRITLVGTREWVNKHGELHRIDGPACEPTYARPTWWLNGEQYTFAEWLERTPLTPIEKLYLANEYDL